MRAVVLDGNAHNPGDLDWAPLKALFERVDIYDYLADKEETIKRIGDAQFLFTNKAAITAEIIDACPNLKYIGEMATGYNNIDVAYAAQKGIVFTNVPAYSTASVAQHTIALLLALTNHVQPHTDSVLRGEWETSPQFCYWLQPIVELAGKTIGLIGFGNTGIQTANIAMALGMKVLVYTRTVKPGYECENLRFASLDEVLAGSDVLSLHCPLNAATDKMINAAAIAKMKDGALLINTARGGLLNEQDVANALNCGKLGGAALDVLSTEPPKDNPLLKAKNCILTPHIAWASIEARSRLMDVVVQNAADFINGNPQNVVK